MLPYTVYQWHMGTSCVAFACIGLDLQYTVYIVAAVLGVILDAEVCTTAIFSTLCFEDGCDCFVPVLMHLDWNVLFVLPARLVFQTQAETETGLSESIHGAAARTVVGSAHRYGRPVLYRI